MSAGIWHKAQSEQRARGGLASGMAERAAAARQDREEREQWMAAKLRRLVAALWPQESEIPPLEGGRLFRMLADATDVSESAWSDVATRAGLWGGTAAVDRAAGERMRAEGVSVMTGAEVLACD